MARSLFLSSMALFLAACGEASLKDFRSSGLSLDLGADGRVVVSLGSTPKSCLTLTSTLTATVNGVPLTFDSQGGEFATSAGWSCQTPQLSAALPESDEPDALVELDDGETRMVLLARNAFAERTLTAAPSGDDDEWAFLWSPSTDVGRSASWRLESGSAPQFGTATVDGERLLLDLSKADTSSGTLRVDGEASAPIDRCEGVEGCSATVRVSTGEIRLSGGVQ